MPLGGCACGSARAILGAFLIIAAITIMIMMRFENPPLISENFTTDSYDAPVLGRLHERAADKRMRDVYAERTSWGLAEYSSSGGDGDVGVDVGPYGLDEYGGRQTGYNDGLPAQWILPESPVRWYTPDRDDYYGPEGPTLFSDGMSSTFVPDHDPLET